MTPAVGGPPRSGEGLGGPAEETPSEGKRGGDAWGLEEISQEDALCEEELATTKLRP